MPGLTRSARNRRLKSLAPSTLYVMGRDEQSRFRGPGRGKEGPRQITRTDAFVDIGWKTQVLAWDLDMRELVSRVQVSLAEHYGAMLVTGRQADGRRLPAQTEKSRRRKELAGAIGKNIGVFTGAMALNYQWSRVTGSTMRARGHVQPFVGAMPGDKKPKDKATGRTKWAATARDSHGIELVSSEGTALNAIRDAVSQYMTDAKATADGRVSTRERPAVAKGGMQWGRVPTERQ